MQPSNSSSSMSEIHELGRALANTVLLLAILVASVGIPWLGLQGVFEHAHSWVDGVIVLLKQTYWILREQGITFFTNPLYYAGFSVLLVIQALRPAISSDRLFGRGLMTDVLWMFFYTLMLVGFIGVFLRFSAYLFAPLVELARAGVLSKIPTWLAILLGYLVSEFLGWFSHLLRHKVTLLWFFHEVHHSQTEMNPFTPFRVHPIDHLASQAIILLPAIFFEQTLGIALIYLSVFQFHDALCHSNIRSNFGWLRFIFVTPQAHRVHHSLEREYYDKNLGVTLCIWDRLFGTYSPSDHVYDKTGTSDVEFPLETGTSIARWPLTVLRQLLYPYKKAIRHVLDLYPQGHGVQQPHSVNQLE